MCHRERRERLRWPLSEGAVRRRPDDVKCSAREAGETLDRVSVQKRPGPHRNEVSPGLDVLPDWRPRTHIAAELRDSPTEITVEFAEGEFNCRRVGTTCERRGRCSRNGVIEFRDEHRVHRG